MAVELLVVLLLILINGFFSMSEMAVVSSRKARLKHEADNGRKNYKQALETADSPSRFLSTIQVAITLIGTLTGALGGATVAESLTKTLQGVPFLARAAAPLSLTIVVLVTTFISVVLGELVPKSLALSKPEAIAAAVVKPINAIAVLFSPLVRLLSGATDGIVSLLHMKEEDAMPVTEEEVKVLIAQGAEAGVFDDREREMFEGVLALGDKRVTALMTPRPDVVFVPVDSSPENFKELVIGHASLGYLPLADGDLDRVVGMIPVKDALAALAIGKVDAPSSFAKKPVFVPEGLTALKAITAIKDGEVQSALIVDEYGGVSGLVALSDLLEAVVGELSLPGDAEEPSMLQREDGSWLVDGALPVDEFLATLGLSETLGQGDYETVAGLVLDCMGSIPRAGDVCAKGGFRIEVIDMDGNRIDKILVTLQPEEREGQQATEE